MPWVESDSAYDADYSAVDPNATFAEDDPNLPHVDIGGGRWAESDSPEASFADPLKRQAGLTVRDAITGLMSLPMMVGDAANALVNLPIKGANALGDMVNPGSPDIPELKPASHGLRDILNSIGLPEPANPAERIAEVGASAMGGAGLAKLAAGTLPGIAGALGKMLAEAPRLQTAGAMAGAASVEGARKSGIDNPAGLMGLALMGSLAPGTAGTAAMRALNLGKAAVQPFSYSGREALVGGILNRLSTNRNLAPDRMASAQEIVPGSRPTISQVSRDPGLISAESAIQSALDSGVAGGGAGRILARRTEQNQARQALLDTIDLPPAEVARLKAELNRTFKQEAAPAFDEQAANKNLEVQFPQGFPGHTPDLRPVFQRIAAIRGSPKAGQGAVQDAMNFAERKLSQENVDLTNAETLYGVRKDLNDARMGKFNEPGKSDLRVAKGQLTQVINALDGAIERVAPGYRRYMDIYAARAKPLTQDAIVKDIRTKGQDVITDSVGGVKSLNPISFQRQLQAAIARGALKKEKRLSDEQLAVMQRVADDLDRGAAASSRGIKTGGSDTFRNFSVANAIGMVLGSNVPKGPTGQGLQTLLSPLSWLYRFPDEAIGQMLVEAVLDPQFAARAMRQASAQEVEHIAKELALRAAQQGIAGQAYAAPGNTP